MWQLLVLSSNALDLHFDSYPSKISGMCVSIEGKKKILLLIADREIQLMLSTAVKLPARKEFHVKFKIKIKSFTHFLNKIRVRNMGIRSERNTLGKRLFMGPERGKFHKAQMLLRIFKSQSFLWVCMHRDVNTTISRSPKLLLACILSEWLFLGPSLSCGIMMWILQEHL